MTREIKFRGKNCKGEWLVGEIISLNNHKYIAPEDGDWFDFIPWVPNNVFHAPDSDEYEVDQETIGQFTGLKDIHDNDIYEGDIIQHMWKATVGRGKNKHEELQPVSGSKPKVISFQMGAFGYINQKETKFMEEEWLPMLDWECEVIGNIHDNPELLNEKDDDEEGGES